jgi:hypothetical protein
VTDQDRGADSTSDPRLRPIVARLQEIERKCRALGPRNEEAREMVARLESVIDQLAHAPGEGAAPPQYRELARRLFPVARLFESLGFMSVAREVAHVDRLLTEMDPESAQPAAPTAPAGLREQLETARVIPPDPGPSQPQAVPTADADRPKAPAAVIASLIVLAIAVVVSVVVVLRQPSGHGELAVRPPGRDAAASTGTESSPSPVVEPEPQPGPRASQGPRSRLADLIGEARLAYQGGNLDEAISLLSQAGSIDPKATPVLETAQVLVEELVNRSDRAADEADWQSAADLLERARELAVRFELSTRPIDEAVHRQGALVHFKRVRPDDRAALESLIGKRVLVLTEGNPYNGTLRGVQDTSLRLELGLEIGNDGALIHTVEVPLRLVREVRYYPG